MTDDTGKQGTGSKNPDNAPDLNELARRLLDLWQDQLTAIAANPDLAAQAVRLMAAMPLPGMWLSQSEQMKQGAGSDDDLTRAWASMTENWLSQDWWRGAPHGSANRASGNAGGHQESGGRHEKSSSSAGTKTAAAASEPGSGHLDELSRRLASIEQRLAELAEHKSKRKAAVKSGAPTAKPRRSSAANRSSGAGRADRGDSD